MDRTPTVAGEPASREYLSRKLADFIDVAWARSHAGDKTGAAIRVTLDGYDVEDRVAAAGRLSPIMAKHNDTWTCDEGPRDSADWFGGNWEIGKYCSCESDEMHETGHLFHELGDLYQYFVEPSLTSGVMLADGRIPQIKSWVWSNQEHANNCNIFSENDVLTHQHVVGMRNAGVDGTETPLGLGQRRARPGADQGRRPGRQPPPERGRQAVAPVRHDVSSRLAPPTRRASGTPAIPTARRRRWCGTVERAALLHPRPAGNGSGPVRHHRRQRLPRGGAVRCATATVHTALHACSAPTTSTPTATPGRSRPPTRRRRRR